MVTRKVVYCVQPFVGPPGHVEGSRLRQFGDLREALAVGERMKQRSRGLIVFKVEGEPDFDLWEHEVLVSYGEVPRAGGAIAPGRDLASS